MMSLYLIFGAGLLGILGHWVTRWSQGRTQSTFLGYLSAYRSHTLSSLFANLGSSGLIYSSTPEDIAGRALVLVVIGAYVAGYTLDSKINRDESLSDKLVHEKLKKLQRENATTIRKPETTHADEDLIDVLRRDADL
jgi:uncharacterized membrane protein YeaQ/YmgE (transglycosylase-associated protein family)